MTVLTSENIEPSMEKAARVPPMKKAAGRKSATAVIPATVANARPIVLAAMVRTSGPAQYINPLLTPSSRMPAMLGYLKQMYYYMDKRKYLKPVILAKCGSTQLTVLRHNCYCLLCQFGQNEKLPPGSAMQG